MFYPLVSGREGGSGLGLALAQSFVQQHHGTIECESRPGFIYFTILMPLGLISADIVGRAGSLWDAVQGAVDEV